MASKNTLGTDGDPANAPKNNDDATASFEVQIKAYKYEDMKTHPAFVEGRKYAYDEGKDAFVSPVTGTYIFNIRIKETKPKTVAPFMVLQLQINGVEVPLSVNHNKPWTASAVLTLDEGKTVSVKLDPDGFFEHFESVEYTFSGALMREQK